MLSSFISLFKYNLGILFINQNDVLLFTERRLDKSIINLKIPSETQAFHLQHSEVFSREGGCGTEVHRGNTGKVQESESKSLHKAKDSGLLQKSYPLIPTACVFLPPNSMSRASP